MVPKFTDDEKAHIRARLRDEAKALFIQHGLRKTSIDDIVAKAQIAKGSFYAFFESKEALYYEILLEEEHFRTPIIDALIDKKLPPGKSMRSLLKKTRAYMNENPFLMRTVEREDYAHLYRKLPPELLAQNLRDDRIEAGRLLKHIKKHGGAKGVSVNTFTGMLRAYFVLFLHKSEIGEDEFEPVMEFLEAAIAHYLSGDET